MKKLFEIFMQKSPKQRFLFILGLLLVVTFFGLASIMLFTNKPELNISNSGRKMYGGLLMVYAIYRFYKLNNSFHNED